MTQPGAFAVFHLNLAFSSIPVEKRPEVVERCYSPLLDLVEAGFPLGIELTGWTLERLVELDPDWVARLRVLLDDGSCELVGSGHSQIIGPLVPAAVNRHNQRLGLEVYEEVLGRRPEIVLVNEMAFSSSLVDLYADAGYRGLIMDRDNVRLALDIEDRRLTDVPSHAAGPGGAELPVLWADSILFQKLQQVAHGDIGEQDYLRYLGERIGRGERLLPLYANDAETFDFRPGRFEAEAQVHSEGEWRRVERLFRRATDEHELEWLLPTVALQAAPTTEASPLTSAAYPIPVKKQAKYNLARWAITGRDDAWLNTMAHRIGARLDEEGDASRWRKLCELWGTDLRTHITEQRWTDALQLVEDAAAAAGVNTEYATDGVTGETDPPEVDGVAIVEDDDGIALHVETSSLRVVLNRRRGLTIRSLGFAGHAFEPAVGTLPHGYFNSIALGADFYTGGVVVELSDEHRRITDLEWVEPRYAVTDGVVRIGAAIDTPLGPIEKAISIPAEGGWIDLHYRFPGWERPKGTIRVGKLTLLPEAFDGALSFGCVNGGDRVEWFDLDRPVDHADATSALISSTAGVGASDGRLLVGQPGRRIEATWDPAVCAAFPMMLHQPSHPGALTRVLFSLLELDDTSRPGRQVGSFTLRVSSSS